MLLSWYKALSETQTKSLMIIYDLDPLKGETCHGSADLFGDILSHADLLEQ
jgi:hypothetical protein